MALNRQWYRDIYLKSPHWYRFRNEIVRMYPMCAVCGKKPTQDVHHKYYRKNGKSILGFERPRDVVACCRTCHKWLDRKRVRQKVVKRIVRFFF